MTFIKLTEAYIGLRYTMEKIDRNFFVNVNSIDAVVADGEHSQVWISKQHHYCWESVSEVMERIAEAEKRFSEASSVINQIRREEAREESWGRKP